MNASDMIAALTYMKDTWGDLEIRLESSDQVYITAIPPQPAKMRKKFEVEAEQEAYIFISDWPVKS